MSRLAKPLTVGALALVLAARPAAAQLWYNGNWSDWQTVLPSERDLSIADTRIFDDFLVGGAGWNVTSIFGDFLSDLNPTQAYWEIRSGVSAGNGGTLLYSGTSSISWALLGPGLGSDPEYQATVGGLNLSLTAGIYWLTIAPTQSAYGRAYITATGGTGGVNPLLDGNAYWDSQSFGKNFQAVTPILGKLDFAYGVSGSALELLESSSIISPEPGTFVLTGSGLVLLGAATLQRRRRASS